MIRGVGTDLVQINRLSLEKAFIERILTIDEIALLHALKVKERQLEFLAGRFAAKEAIMKALGTGIGNYSFQDFSILPDALGQPHCDIPGYTVHLSITHDAGLAMAFVVMEDEL